MHALLNILAAIALCVLPVSAPCLCGGFKLVCACDSGCCAVSEPSDGAESAAAEEAENGPRCCCCGDTSVAESSCSAETENAATGTVPPTKAPCPNPLPCRGKAKLLPGTLTAPAPVVVTSAAQALTADLPPVQAAVRIAPALLTTPFRPIPARAEPPPNGLIIAASVRLLV